MAMGDSVSSITTLPQVHRGIDNALYCDCPGFDDNRSIEMRVCANLAIELVSARAISGRGTGFVKLMQLFNQLFCSVDELSASLICVFTKVPDNVSREYLLKKLKDLQISQQESLSSLTRQYENRIHPSLESDQSIEQKISDAHAAITILNLILSNEKSVYIGNLFDKGALRITLMKAVRSLTPLTYTQFNFQNASVERAELETLVTTLLQEEKAFKTAAQTLPEEINALKKRSELLAAEQARKNQFLSEYYNKQSQYIQLTVILDAHNRAYTEVSNLLRDFGLEKDSMVSSKTNMEKRLTYLDSDEPYPFWSKTRSGNPSSATYAAPGIKLASTIFNLGALGDMAASAASYAAERSGPVEVFSYKGPAICSHEVQGKGGVFTGQSINQEGGSLTFTFQASNSENWSATVTVYVKRRHVPENVTEISRLKNSIAQLTQSIQRHINHITELTRERSLLESTISKCQTQKNAKLDEGIPEQLRKHVAQIDNELVEIYTQQLAKEKELSHVQEELRAKAPLYQVINQISILLSTNKDNMSLDTISLSDPPSLVPIPLQVDSNVPDLAQQVQALQLEVKMMREQIQTLQKQVNQLLPPPAPIPTRQHQGFQFNGN